MNKNTVTTNKITQSLLIVYLLALLWIIVFKLNVSFTNAGNRSINLIPFHQPMILNGKTDYGEMILNVLIFIPLGIYLGILLKKTSRMKKVLIFSIVSLSLELQQYFFKLGAFDITDVITNSFGGMLGLILLRVMYQLIKNEVKTQKIINVLAGIGSITILSFLVLLKLNLLPIRYQ